MCGIAGIVAADPALRARLPRVLESIAHRGPDDQGIETLDEAALGHRRLSILDLTGGHQPMFDATGNLAIVFNGEIYNFPRQRAALEQQGRRFRTNSDTELILHLYDLHGDDCVLHLEGMFAFAIWDRARHRLFMARDHMGQKPLFWAQRDGAFVFASEVKGVLASGLVRPETNLEALSHYISLRCIPDDLTLFSGVIKLPAAHRLVYENGRVKVERYWSFSCVDKLAGSESELLDELDRRLHAAVKDHMLADVPVGAFLSGGNDSSLITAMAARQSPGPIPTFSIGVREQGFNELPYARMVAERYRTQHHEEIATADLLHLVPKMIWHLDEPSDPFAAGCYLVSRLAAKHVKVVLSGDGGDELFAGYDRFAGNRLADALRVLPAPLRRGVVRQAIDALPESFAYKGLSQKLRWLNEMSLVSDGGRYAESMSFLRFTEDAKARLFTPAARARLNGLDSRAKILEHFESPNAKTLVDRMLYTDLMTRMPDHLLPIVDRMAMAHGLEVRPPLLEHTMVEYAMRIPEDMKLRGTTLKYALRRLAARYLDPALVTRRKQGFGFPLAHWMRNELSGFLRAVVAESRFVSSGIFEQAAIAELVGQHIAGKRDHNFRLWVLLNLEIWHRMYIEGMTMDEVAEWIERHGPPARVETSAA
jgi:asparagine synthase (glutamine-hydrolysing)